MTTLRARSELEKRERDFRLKELRRLLDRHSRDPNYHRSCAGWRRELLDLRDSEITSLPEPSWSEAKAHAIGQIAPGRQLPVYEVRRRYYAMLQQRSFLYG